MEKLKDHRISVFVKTRKRQWNDNDEMYFKNFQCSFEIDCSGQDFEILMELNKHQEKDGYISCLKIPQLIDSHMGHSDELNYDDDEVILLQTTDNGIAEYDKD
ncbi:hypothetical protein [Maribacter sp.]|uniref:hypothetical protein n=1 Tax=Maribacter sp. TaxID=1897614 RepID=UPI0025BF3870|nr:hypothetical protein [Maribacter sp.]